MPVFPPRPQGAIPPQELNYYEKTGLWVAQYKYNGAHNTIHIEPDGKVSFWNYGTPHLKYTLTAKMRDQILALPGIKPGVEYWLDSEFLNKTSAKDTKEKVILFDVLQADKYLFLCPLMTRLQILKEICGNPVTFDDMRNMAYVVSEDVLMAPTFTENFLERFNHFMDADEVEGIVLKKKASVLDNFGQKRYEIPWIIRCRHPHKNFNF